MSMVASSALPALEQIHNLNMRAVFGGTLFILCCLIALGLFKNTKSIQSIFIVLIGAIAFVSGILLASALYVIQNPIVVWGITL